jgi:WXG100 family type VII secretion target
MAAAVRILVEIQVIVDTYGDYRRRIIELLMIFLKLLQVVMSLRGVWSGDAANTFYQKFEEFYNNIKLSEAKMQDAIDELTRSSALFAQAEAEVKNLASGLQVGTSPFNI